jgi:hypothetical protein
MKKILILFAALLFPIYLMAGQQLQFKAFWKQNARISPVGTIASSNSYANIIDILSFVTSSQLLASSRFLRQDATLFKRDSIKINLGFKKKSGFHQFISEVFDWKYCTALSFALGAGYANGMQNMLVNNYTAFQERHPGANANRCNPTISWREKYKDGDPEKGELFPGSTTVFVGTTDLWHGFQTVRDFCIGISATIPWIPDKKVSIMNSNGNVSLVRATYQYKNKWYVIVSKALLQITVFNLGKEIALHIYR